MMSITFGEMLIDVMNTCGVHANLCIATYARIAYCGVAASTTVFAPDDFSAAICDSIDESVGSYDCVVTICPAFAPRPLRRPAATSLPYAEFSCSTAIF